MGSLRESISCMEMEPIAYLPEENELKSMNVNGDVSQWTAFEDTRQVGDWKEKSSEPIDLVGLTKLGK